jgi:hypothetical protein
MSWELAHFVWNLIITAAISTWSSMGTNGLGWIIGLGTPFLVLVMKMRRAEKGARLKFIFSQWRDDVRDVFVVYLAIGLTIFIWELSWNIPHQTWRKAELTAIPSISAHIPVPFIEKTHSVVPSRSSNYLVGADLKIGAAYYLNGSTLSLAEANTSTMIPAVCVASSATRCIYSGTINTGTWKAGGELYLSDSTPGGLTQTHPSASGHCLQVMGFATSATQILVRVSSDYGCIQ